MSDTRNALAELADRLKGKRGRFTYEYDRRDICKAQRIVAELAKVQIADGMARRVATRANCLEYSFGNEPPRTVGIFVTEHFPKWICSALNAIEKCRAIAEEKGDGDGK